MVLVLNDLLLALLLIKITSFRLSILSLSPFDSFFLCSLFFLHCISLTFFVLHYIEIFALICFLFFSIIIVFILHPIKKSAFPWFFMLLIDALKSSNNRASHCLIVFSKYLRSRFFLFYHAEFIFLGF